MTLSTNSFFRHELPSIWFKKQANSECSVRPILQKKLAVLHSWAKHNNIFVSGITSSLVMYSTVQYNCSTLYTRTLRHSQTHPSLSPSPGHSQRLCYKMTHDILLNYCYRHPACSTSHYIGFTDLRVLYTLHRIRVCNFRGQFRMIPDIICQSVPGYMATIWRFTFSFCSGL